MTTKKYIDMMGRTVELNSAVCRIVSLVPSQTELLVDLGLKEKLVGITKFCIHPKELRSEITSIGGPKKLNIKKILAQNPDLVIANKEENLQAEIEELAKHVPVWISDVYTLEDSLEMIRLIGEITQTLNVANEMCRGIQDAFDKLNTKKFINNKVVYLIWKDPFMAVGPNTFIDDMLMKIGLFNNVKTERYPELKTQELNPDYVFLSSEPYPFSEKHFDEVQQFFPHSKLILVDGEFFTWYGSRMLKAPAYFMNLMDEL